MSFKKPKLSFWQIWNMNVGFLGIQFSFGLQQTAISPIFQFLGANPHDLPILNLAGPVTGFLIQPMIGAISDKTWSPKWGRRKPFFLIGAVLASLVLFGFPFTTGLGLGIMLYWMLDIGNNTAMEPYRAFVGDKLPDEQLTFGYQMQSLFVGAGIVLANASIFLFKNYLGTDDQTIDGIPSWLYYPFFIGSILSLVTILWSVLKTPEIPPTDKELKEIKASRDQSFIKKAIEPFVDIYQAIKHMPKFMWKLAAVYLFQWYALFIYFQFIAPMFELSLGFDKSEALAQSSKMNLTYNFVTMIVALILVPIAARFGNKLVYMMGLFGTGIALLSIPHIQDANLVLLPMILMGIGWAAMMGIPYSMVSKMVPQEKRGVYMGIVNMMIVVPMFIETITFGPIIKYLLGNSAVNAIMFAGVFFIISSILAIRLNIQPSKEV
jgi:maltose/moltooligosaccharide transporter